MSSETEIPALHALDVETACRFNCEKKCKHALTPHTARITCVGIWTPETSYVFRDLLDVSCWLIENPNAVFVGHHFKFDLKMLRHHGVDIPPERWRHDTSLMATASYEKVTERYLDWYEARRKEENKSLTRGHSHRPAGKHSLKTLAPFFLGVDPFWENPEDHDNDEYVLRDCEYAYRLYEFLLPRLKEQDTYRFYENHLLPWAKMFLRAEERGVKLDLGLLATKKAAAEAEATRLKAELEELWQEPIKEDLKRKQIIMIQTIDEQCERALGKLKPLKSPKDPAKRAAKEEERRAKTLDRHEEKKAKALATLEPFSIDSPKQLLWLLRDYYGLPVKNFEGDESTGVAVLKRLAKTTERMDIELLLDYRKQQKLATSFYPRYEELHHNSVLHCNFNLDVTKTGRTSSSGPNLQQVPGDIHDLFVARPGYRLITKDLSGIEPALIAYYSEDKELCSILIEERNFHDACTLWVFGLNCLETAVKAKYPAERRATKEFDLSKLYGAGWRRAQQSLRKHGFHWNESRVREAIEALDKRLAGVKDFKRVLDKRAETTPIRTMFGMKRDFRNDYDNIYMQAFNGLIQGSAGQLLLQAALKAQSRYDDLKLDAQVLLFVHDEVVVEAAADIAEQAAVILDECMTDFPLDTKWGKIPLKTEGNIADFWSK